ncbi:MAG TPA: DUF2298 domain-containing protein, partial [Thermoanaerobaculia bacterium]|nr:DUF2298 domain-containing protein [Thermoanaerobaculia bacterium]
LPVGLVLVAFPGWLLSAALHVSIGRVVLPLAVLTALVALIAFRRSLSGLRRAAHVPVLVAVTFLFFLWLRFPDGEIRQTEKPMDFAVLNALMTTPSLPLQDPWLAGERFSYYHFGTYALSLPARASGIAPEVAYNLLAAFLAAIVAGAAFGAVRLRGGGRKLALFAAFLLVLGGTFDGARQVLGGTPLDSINVWISSRRVEHAITEWPFFTLKLGDLHPHAVAMPLFVALMGLAGCGAGIAGAVLDAALLAALLSANPWDLPGALLALGAGNLAARPFVAAVGRAAGTCALSLPFLAPFLLSPRPPFFGLRGVSQATQGFEGFLHFGALVVVPALAIGVATVRLGRRPDEAFLYAILFPAAGTALAIATQHPVLGLAGAFVLAVLFVLPELGGALRAGALFAACGATLAAVPELVAVVDPYGEEMHRMNTVFKCYAAAALFFAVASALLLPLALATRRARKTVRVLLAVTFLGALAHPLGAFIARMKSHRGALDGLTWMSRGDRDAVNWLRVNADPADAVAEAWGGAYDDHGRIGSACGRPTLLGWAGHEGIWRGDAWTVEIEKRKADLKTIYTSRDAAEVTAALSRRGIRYVAVGGLERKDYGEDALPVRGALLLAFDGGETKLYRAR